MSKVHRGKGIKSMSNHGRGECPLCHSTGVKLLYENEVDGVKQMICKICSAKSKNAK